jgi:hypothetical protein
MGVAEWVVVGARSNASIGQVTKLVNVETMEVVGRKASKLSANLSGRKLANLLKTNQAFRGRSL